MMTSLWQDGGGLEFHFWWRLSVFVFHFPGCCDVLHMFPAGVLSPKFSPKELYFPVMLETLSFIGKM